MQLATLIKSLMMALVLSVISTAPYVYLGHQASIVGFILLTAVFMLPAYNWFNKNDRKES